MINMPRSKGKIKGMLLSTRVTDRIATLAERAAEMDGLTLSEWVRSIIIKELRERGLLGSPK